MIIYMKLIYKIKIIKSFFENMCYKNLLINFKNYKFLEVFL